MTFVKNSPTAVVVSTLSRTNTTSTPAPRSVRSISITSLTDLPTRSIDGKTATSHRPAFASAMSLSSSGRSRSYPETPASRYTSTEANPLYSAKRRTSASWASRP